jgi:DNA-binding transcriptional ArsR family regulator
MLLKWLRAAGEPSRLRLLALCAEGALSVSDLAQALRQSEARVSRHLKILCEAGLIERLRQGQWVHYRIAAAAESTSFSRGLLAQLDRRDPQLLRDVSAARAAAAPDAQRPALGGESRLGRALAGFFGADATGTPLGAVLVVGVTHPELLERAARAAQHCTALAASRRAAQGARAFAERRGFACDVRQPSSPEVLHAAALAPTGSQFEAVLLDHPPVTGEALARQLEQARRLLTPAGRLWLFEPYESLESSRGRIVEHPLARLRRLLGAADLVCERLSPLEADGQHVIAALARPAAPDQVRSVHTGVGPP